MRLTTDLTGWELEEARKALDEDEGTRVLPIRVIETVAPHKKIDDEIERFGRKRVLRVRQTERDLELTVAREQIVD
jgi:hypothetical protein